MRLPYYLSLRVICLFPALLFVLIGDVSGAAGQPQVSAGWFHTVGVKVDGMAEAAGLNDDGQCDLAGWTDIVQVSADAAHTVGLRSDGTVVAAGKNEDGQCDVSDWTDIVQVSAGTYHTVGRKTDGTVVAAGSDLYNKTRFDGWTDLADISAGAYHTVGIRTDGTAVAVGLNSSDQCDVGTWTDMRQVDAGYYHTVGIRNDGTAVAVGYNDYGQCDVDGWTDLLQIVTSRYHTVGLKADGTVVATGLNVNGQCDVADMTNILQVAVGLHFTVGLQADGRTQTSGLNSYGEIDLAFWDLDMTADNNDDDDSDDGDDDGDGTDDDDSGGDNGDDTAAQEYVWIGGYLPLQSGNVWEYKGADEFSLEVSDWLMVDGVLVKMITRSDGGESVLYAQGHEGLVQYGEEGAETGERYDELLRLLPANAMTGSVYSDAGTSRTYDVQGAVTGSGEVSITATVSGPESVTLPETATINGNIYSVFDDCLKMTVSVTKDSGSFTETRWLARKVGIVKLERGENTAYLTGATLYYDAGLAGSWNGLLKDSQGVDVGRIELTLDQSTYAVSGEIDLDFNSGSSYHLTITDAYVCGPTLVGSAQSGGRTLEFALTHNGSHMTGPYSGSFLERGVVWPDSSGLADEAEEDKSVIGCFIDTLSR